MDPTQDQSGTEGIGQGAVLMNHDNDLKVLGLALKLVLAQYDAEIAQIKDPKHRIGVIQEFEKAQHYMIKMTKAFDDLNSWFTAFGLEGEKP